MCIHLATTTILTLQKTDVIKALTFVSLASNWEQLKERVMNMSFDFSVVYSNRVVNFRKIPSYLWDER